MTDRPSLPRPEPPDRQLTLSEAARIDGTLTGPQRLLFSTAVTQAFWRGRGQGLVVGFVLGSAFSFGSLALFRFLL